MMSASLDLWAMIMLGSGAVAASGLLGLAVTRTGPKATAATWIGNIGLLGVLSGALVGARTGPSTADEIVSVRESAPSEVIEAAPPPEQDVRVAARPEPAVDDSEAEPEVEIEADEKGDVEANGPPAEPEPAEPEPEPEPAAAPSAADWPEDPEALKTAVRTLLHEAKTLAADEARCKDAAAIGTAWAKVATVPADVYPDRVEVIRVRLEECRKKVLWATRYSVRKDRVTARETFASDLKKSLVDQELRAIVTAHGRDNELLRIGSTLIDEAKANEMLDGSLTADAAKLGFQKVTIANGKSNYVRELEATLDQAVIDATLAEHHLDAPLALPSTN